MLSTKRTTTRSSVADCVAQENDIAPLVTPHTEDLATSDLMALH